MKRVVRLLLAVLMLPVLYVSLAVVLGLVPVNRDFDTDQQDGVEVFVWSNGVHTSFVVPLRSDSVDWAAQFPGAHFRNVAPEAMTHAAFGWGDQGFYLETPTWGDLTVGTTVRALFARSETAMHVTYLRRPRPSATMKRLVVTEQQYALLVDHITTSFRRTDDGALVWIEQSGYGPRDTFYEAVGSYNLFQTCNDWTGRGLRSIGVRMGVWTPFAQSVMHHL